MGRTNPKAPREKRRRRIRSKVMGTPSRPRLTIFRSNKHMYAQIVDDYSGHTIVSASTLDPELSEELPHGGNMEAAERVGELVAQRALENDVEEVVFDRAGYDYHGRVAAVAEAAREEGLKF